jgi:hypothetical protein
MIEGSEQLEERTSRYSNDSGYDWEYGNSRKNSYYDAPVINYRDIEVSARSTGKVSAYQFRSAESFLNSIAKPKGADINLDGYKAGVKVFHKKFGEGVISSVEAEGEDLKVDINFDKVGHKRLMAKFAGLEIIE